MESIASAAGVDVSKDRLDLKIPSRRVCVLPNSALGYEKVFSSLPEGMPVVVESSGGYERGLVRYLREREVKVIVLNPCRARQFARGMGQKAKTDAIDAEFLSLAGTMMPEPLAKDREREELGDLSRHIQRLKEDLACVKKRLLVPELAGSVTMSLFRLQKLLKEEISVLEKEFLEKVGESHLAKPYSLALSVPGVGKVSARILVCELPSDPHQMNAKRISCYAGLAPIDDSSGKRTGAKRLPKGNARLKAALYLPALVCLHRESWAKELYTRLREKGKSHQSATVALMRRLLIRVVAVIKRGTAWKPVPNET